MMQGLEFVSYYPKLAHYAPTEMMLCFSFLGNGRNRMVWKNLREGRHSIYLKAYCINNEMKRYIIVRKRFRFRIRRNNFIPLYGAS